MKLPTVSESLCIGETIELQIEHGYMPNSREAALVTLIARSERPTPSTPALDSPRDSTHSRQQGAG